MSAIDIIYKICPKEDWDDACKIGFYSGSEDDLRDGFIHFSTKAQVEKTLSKHFSGQKGLLLLAVDVSYLNPSALKYETSRRGEKYPHLYGKLLPSMVKARYIIELNDVNEHVIDF
ncbi:MAG: DUF952 domain-containing protein [Emcibacter sp.]|nr:DUF952 domain-containing protein [Emcibacter sp.]